MSYVTVNQRNIIKLDTISIGNVTWGRGGDHLLSLELSEIDLFLLRLTCGLRTTSRILPKY